MTQKEFLSHTQQFAQNYTILYTNIEEVDKKYEIGNFEDKVCRFCGRDTTQTTFDNVSHAIPESLGNKTIICLDECDNCNRDFSNQIENHLDKITLPYRTINFLKGKKKVPKYKTLDEKLRIETINREKKEFKVEARVDSDFIDMNEETKTITINYDLQSHIPSAAYKALVKMALSVIPESELENFNICKQWILEKDHSKDLMSPLKVLMTFVPGINPFKKTIVFLFKQNHEDEKYPCYMFVIAFGNVMYQIVVPSDKEITQSHSNKTLLKFLSPFEVNWALGNPVHRILDWSQNTIRKAHKEYFEFGYDEMKQIIKDGQQIDTQSLQKHKEFQKELDKYQKPDSKDKVE